MTAPNQPPGTVGRQSAPGAPSEVVATANPAAVPASGPAGAGAEQTDALARLRKALHDLGRPMGVIVPYVERMARIMPSHGDPRAALEDYRARVAAVWEAFGELAADRQPAALAKARTAAARLDEAIAEMEAGDPGHGFRGFATDPPAGAGLT